MSAVSRLLSVACLGGALCAATVASSLAAELNPVRSAPKAAASPAATARVIVKFRSGARLQRTAVNAGASFPRAAAAVAQRLSLPVSDGRGLGPTTQVLFARGVSSEEFAARLAGEPDVEWAVVDGRRYPSFVPNDPLFGGNQTVYTPTVGQWYLRAPNAPDNLGVVSAIDAEGAWDITQGASNFVIADVDTGITAHPDLQNQLYYSGTTPYGYDFIGFALTGSETAAEAVLTANDGDLADPDPSDPGDWITSAENAGTVDSGYFKGCAQSSSGADNSSWHGTQTAGIMAAQSGNGMGMAGIVPNAKLVPVRVLGKCGGYDSDIIAGMEWAAGVTVGGAPANLHPARVVNMSLGGQGSCTSAYQDAINLLTSLNVVVVVAAGNDEGLAVGVPANCTGVVAVAGLRHVGDKVGFSDIGPQVTIAAPAGNCVNTSSSLPCLYPILTTSNDGATAPGNAIYTDSYNASLGTSFAAPMVSGAVALMLSVSPQLTNAEVISILQSTATPFPTSGGSAGTVACVAPTANVQDECYCTTTPCGAGMLNARAAVSRANTPFPVLTGATTGSVGAQVALDGSTSVVPAGRTVATYAWQIIAGNGVATLNQNAGSSVTLTGVSAGTVTVQLTVTDSAGASQSTSQSIVFSAPGGGGGGGGGGGAANPLWLIGLVLAGGLLAPRRRPARVPG